MIHLYYGDGKGKTTSAIGLCIRACGAGKRVIFLQFMKGNETSELAAMKQLSGIRILRSAKDYGFYKQMTEEEKQALKMEHDKNLLLAREAVCQGQCNLLVLDEVTYAFLWELVDRTVLMDFLRDYGDKTEIVLTGRNPDKFFLEQADYITNMKCERHPFERGIPARKGIEY